MERNATHNLAEHLLWSNELDESIQLARRGLALQQRVGEGATSLDRLLLARVLAARGEVEELRDVLATFVTDERAGEDEVAGDKTIEVLRAIAAGADLDGWAKALHGTGDLFLQMRLELWHLAARHGRLSDDLRASARELARTDPVWARRVDEF